MTTHDSYDQYADQLLNSVFANVKQSTAAPLVNTSREDQLLSQLLQHANISSPAPTSPFLNNSNTNNEWLLLQQLQQQQQLIEKQLSELTSSKTKTNSSPAVQIPVVESSSSSPLQSSEMVAEDIKPKKIPRVPVQQQAEKAASPDANAAIVKTSAVALNNAGNKPPLPKKKSFIRRTLSRRNFKDRENVAPAPTTAKSVQPKATKQQPVAVVDKSPTFWRPREERPKGWWKGNVNDSAVSHDQQSYQYEEEEEVEESSEEEVPVPVPVPVKKTKKRVPVPQQKVASIKKPARPMAFKTPTVKAKKKKNKAKKESTTTTAAAKAKSAPMYEMPQQPMYYQQPIMMAAPQPYMMPGQGGFCYMPGQGMMTMSQSDESTDKATVTRKKTILNPREASNDKCSIM